MALRWILLALGSMGMVAAGVVQFIHNRRQTKPHVHASDDTASAKTEVPAR
jgi:hypothetical protein